MRSATPTCSEFLDLKDEYSESDLEEALVRHLEWFLLELGTGFTFVARQKRIRIGDEWYRIDLLLFHRRLRCLVVIDLKIGKFTHADAGQMNLYLNYVREHMMEPGENDPVGLILCSAKNDAVVHYAMGGIKAKVFASHYLTDLPDPETLRQEILTTQHALETRAAIKGPVMANLKPWYKVVTPREDLREGKPLDASEFAVHLDHVRDGRAPAVYQDPKQFFERTYLTQKPVRLRRRGDPPAVGREDRNLGRVQHVHPVRRRQDPLPDAALPSGRERAEGQRLDGRQPAAGAGGHGHGAQGRHGGVRRHGV